VVPRRACRGAAVSYTASRMTPLERKRLERFAPFPKRRLRVRWGRVALFTAGIILTILVIVVPGSRSFFSVLLMVDLLAFASSARAYPRPRGF
jgi:hypothetical protein